MAKIQKGFLQACPISNQVNRSLLRYFLEIAYDGTDFFGWQVQPDRVTVQGTINEVLTKILQQDIHVVGCGRTDTGVHASQFYLHFDTEIEPPQSLVYKLNRMLPKSIAVKQSMKVAEDAHARFDAHRRSYRYQVHFEKNPFLQAFSHYCPFQLDTDRMKEVAESFINYHDFAAVRKRNEDIPNTICEIYSSKIIVQPDRLQFEISANRFLHNMIRRMMGLLILVGQEKITPQEVREVFEKNSNFKLNNLAPANGLTLTGVSYPFID